MILSPLAETAPPPQFFVNFASIRYQKLMQAIIMQFQGKLEKQTCKNGRKPSFGPHSGPFWPKFDPQNSFCEVYLY